MISQLTTTPLVTEVAKVPRVLESATYHPQEANRLLLELNRAIAAGEIDYHPFERTG